MCRKKVRTSLAIFSKKRGIEMKKDDRNFNIRFSDLLLQGLNIGALIGISVFALIGLLPSSFFSGIIGLKKIAGFFSNMEVLPRIFAPVIMILGLMVIGVICITGASLVAGLLSNYKSINEKRLKNIA